jgi:hypothetical protein
MLKKKSIFILLIILVLCFSIGTCFARSIITGRVIDAETGKPVANAAFYIGWYKETGLPGLSSAEEVETAEGYTDAEGYFKVPKYSRLFNLYQMAIYKKGYVCGASDKIFPTWEERNDFKPKNKMVIKLEKFKEEYSKEDHARFTVFAPIVVCPSRLFDEAIRPERDMRRKIYKEKRGK